MTLVAFLSQVLTCSNACREAVRRVQVWCVAMGGLVLGDNTSGYCQARGRLPWEKL